MLRFKKLLLIITIIFFVGFIPLDFTSGEGALDIAAEAFSKAIVDSAAIIIGLIAGIIQTTAANILNFVLSDQFIGQSGANSSLVQNAWGMVRNFANAALVIGLVIIAINIILGKEEGKAKESLMVFIIAALLINFTPLICGFIIDMANLLGRSLIGGEIGGDIFEKIPQYINDAQKVGDPFQALANILFVFLFSVMTFVVYLLYALLFVVRAVVLWILIIASPIAVATRVFPKSNIIRKFFPNILYWDDWIEMFLQWTMMIVPASFFIYLSNFAMKSVISAPINTGDGNILQQLITALFSYVIPIVILYVGFLLTIIAGGSIAAPIGNMGKKVFGAAKGAVKGAVIGTAKTAGTWTKEGLTGYAGAALNATHGGRFKKYREDGLGIRDSLKKSLNWEAREEGRADWENTKEKYSKIKENIKEGAHWGAGQDYQSRSLETEEVLTKTPEEYLNVKGGSESEVRAKVQMAVQRAMAAEARGDIKKAKDIKKALITAAVNNDKLSNDDIKNLSARLNINMNDFVRKMSPADALKNLNASALAKNEILRNLSASQHKNIYLKGDINQKAAVVDYLGGVNLKSFDPTKEGNMIKNLRESKLAIMLEQDKFENDLHKRRVEIFNEFKNSEKELEKIKDKNSDKAKMLEKQISELKNMYSSLDE